MENSLVDLIAWQHNNVPSGLDHEQSNLMGAHDDNDALVLFLNKAGTRSSETRRRYERETVRFTFFIYQELGINYKGVRLKHLQSYLHFIQNLPESWLSPGILPGSPDKILFKAPIKIGKSTDQVIDVLSTFFTFLEKNRYTLGNPAASLVRSGEKQAKGATVIRYFHDNEWAHLKECLDNMPIKTKLEQKEAERTRIIVATTYALGLRESEITGHSFADIHKDGEGDLYLSVLGKGRKRRQLPISSALYNQLLAFKSVYFDEKNSIFPLAPRLRKSKGEITALSSRGLRFWWQAFMSHCAEQTSDIFLAERIRAIPFHALRHTALTHLARKMDIEDLAIFAGHDSINTTSQYYHAETKRLRALTKDHGI
ncbi:site-specific integrase [Candidatus Sororendozoicomonas aggregata]|uniref:tyrosine-type recombinase/integrase n=1 Tax=Candidatus Sororendozoicomonas aggregata TaxID=3073239 RepID=UPI002ED4F6E6